MEGKKKEREKRRRFSLWRDLSIEDKGLSRKYTTPPHCFCAGTTAIDDIVQSPRGWEASEASVRTNINGGKDAKESAQALPLPNDADNCDG